MLSFKLLQDVQNYINAKKIHDDTKTEIASEQNTEQPQIKEGAFSYNPDCDFPIPTFLQREIDLIGENSEEHRSEALRKSKRTGEFPRITLNNPFRRKMNAEEDIEEDASLSPSALKLSINFDDGQNKEPVYPDGIAGARRDIASRLAEKDESFAEHLIRKIDESKMTDVDCYTKAQISRQLFNKIKNTRDYRPSKATVISLGFALNLIPDDFDKLLQSAGYALSNNNDFDLIVDYCLIHQISNIDDINELLFSFDQPLLGSR